MAISYSHKFGQIIGELLEIAILPHLVQFAQEHNLFLDKKGDRLIRKGKKMSWIDLNENQHDLDFVLERGGTNEKLGLPVAFIETAWRRYTKHSRNKAQEIQGAILPLAEKYKNQSPFLGAVLAGVFTTGAITQLKSVGFCVLYFSYETVLEAFGKFGIDAHFDEDTSEEDFKRKIASWEQLEEKDEVAKELLKLNGQETKEFFSSLVKSISRNIELVLVIPLHGSEAPLQTVVEAINFLKGYAENVAQVPFVKYEIIIHYNTGDKIDASFKQKADAIKFLEAYI